MSPDPHRVQAAGPLQRRGQTRGGHLHAALSLRLLHAAELIQLAIEIIICIKPTCHDMIALVCEIKYFNNLTIFLEVLFLNDRNTKMHHSSLE